MPTVKVHNLKNKEVGEVRLSDAVFDAPFNEPLIHAAVRNFMANARQGTSATRPVATYLAPVASCGSRKALAGRE